MPTAECRPTTTRSPALFKSVKIRVLRFIRVLLLPMIIASMDSHKTHLANTALPELAFVVVRRSEKPWASAQRLIKR